MTAYLVWRDMSLQSIGIWRGIASVIGLLGTITYCYSIQIYSFKVTGMLSIVYQFLCLTFAYLSLFSEHSTYSTLVLVIGVCMSRIGLLINVWGRFYQVLKYLYTTKVYLLMNVLMISHTLPINEFSIVLTHVQIYLTVNLMNLYS